MTETDDAIRRSRGERFESVKVFGVLGFLGFMLALLSFAAPGIVVESVLEGDQRLAYGVSLAVSVPTFIWVCVALARSYRRRSGLGLRVLPDRVERVRRRGVDAIATEDLVFHVFRDGAGDTERVRIHSRGGKTFDLFRGEWPVSRIADELERVAVPPLTERARSLLAAGEPLAFPERPAWSASTVVLATLMVLTGVAILFVSSSEERLSGHQVAKVGRFVIIVLVGVPAFFWRVLSLRGNGVTLTRTGVRRSGEGADRETPFAEVGAFEVGPEGIELRAAQGVYRLSRSGASFAVLANLLRERLSRSA
ncbi:MAG TPA: hypothetical protein VFF73_26435 [Planctomycetota bacterium]|nr:hypothetical protein [Planctomycetota bacterium]